jgi:hypothetical protein
MYTHTQEEKMWKRRKEKALTNLAMNIEADNGSCVEPLRT